MLLAFSSPGQAGVTRCEERRNNNMIFMTVSYVLCFQQGFDASSPKMLHVTHDEPGRKPSENKNVGEECRAAN